MFVAETTFISPGDVPLHRRLGEWSLVVGAAIPVAGVAVSVVMARLRLQHEEADATSFRPVGIADMLSIGLAFGFGMAMRSQRETHCRLMFVATCTLAAAGFLQILQPRLPGMYAGSMCASLLMLVGAARDVVVDRRVHKVLLLALPIYAALEGSAIYLNSDPDWLPIGNMLVQ